MRIPILCLAVVFVGCSRQPDFVFGTFQGGKITPAKTIEYRIGNTYGWRLTFKQRSGSARVKHQFLLPAPAPWNGEDTRPNDNLTTGYSSVKSSDGSSNTTEVTVNLQEVETYEVNYTIIPGDPKGTHNIKIWVNDRIVDDFPFHNPMKLPDQAAANALEPGRLPGSHAHPRLQCVAFCRSQTEFGVQVRSQTGVWKREN